VRDVIFYSEELSNYYSSLGEDDAPLHRSQGAHLPIVAMMNYFIFPMLLTRRFLRFLRLLLPLILPCVTHMFNKVLTCSIFSEAWKRFKILPVPKMSSSGGDYRPISVLPSLSKALEVDMRD
jgi:hypothetical protein